MSAPSSQKADVRPISFTLQDTSQGSVPLATIPLYIRPEELTRTETSRMTVHQTFGGSGGWADSFGPGVPSLSISGHTGWRPGDDGKDGLDRMKQLHDVIFSAWHLSRQLKTLQGLDPDSIQLIFSDAMDDIAWVVAPTQFVLKRDRRRPLLAQYQIGMTYLSQYVATSGGSSSGSTFGALQALGLDSLAAALSSISDFLNGIDAAIKSALGPIVATVKAFVGVVVSVCKAVQSVILTGLKTVNSLTYGLISIAKDLTRAASSVFSVFSMIASIPNYVQAQFMKVRSSFFNIFCVLSNCFQQSRLLQDLSGVYGASNCSSTAGGSSLSTYLNVNTFEAIQATSNAAQVQTRADASASITALKGIDPATNPPSIAQVQGHLTNVVNGLLVN
jgi:hypothetical protein